MDHSEFLQSAELPGCDAYEAELKAYEKIEDAVAYSLNSIKMQASSDCKLRGFDSVLDKTLHQSRMKKETLDAMYEAINEYLPKFHAYLKAKARYLGHDNGLPWYDLFAPVGKNDKTYNLEEAKNYLLAMVENDVKQVMSYMDSLQSVTAVIDTMIYHY